MLALAASDPTAGAPSVPSWAAGRLYTSPVVHVGLRPSGYVDGEGWGAGVTVQVSVAGF